MVQFLSLMVYFIEQLGGSLFFQNLIAILVVILAFKIFYYLGGYYRYD